ncbi:unnamed protein product [Prorocentrum cordatum]|uniref:Amino acid transporter transmembrane domain-containing protein n=1 Tax=Prorocentrum cordatum TaxID=2364126 RepID=A0ABN9RJ58_9DINO|nr:unnamed protein product [Polarella glacialis]
MRSFVGNGSGCHEEEEEDESEQDEYHESDSTDDSCSTQEGIDAVNRKKNSGFSFFIISTAFTLGLVFSPSTLGSAGWYWGTAFWIYSIGSTWLSGIILGHCVMDAAERGVESTYPALVEDSFGSAGWYFAASMQILTYYMVNVSLLVNVADWCLLAYNGLHELSGGNSVQRDVCLWQLLLAAGLVTALLAQIRTFRHLLPFALLSLLSSIIRWLLLFYQVGYGDLVATCHPSFAGVTFKSVLNSLATTAFLFGGHGLFPEEIRELRRPRSYFPALHGTYVLLVTVYISNTYVAYAVWGQWTSADNQFNWPLNWATVTSAFLSVLWGLVEMATCHVLMLSLVERTSVVRKVLEAPRVLCGMSPKVATQARSSLLRLVFVLSEVFFAVMLSAAGLGNINALVGAFGFASLTYYAPFAVYWQQALRRGDAGLLFQVSCFLAILTGVALTLLGTYAAIRGMEEDLQTYTLFDTSRCTVSDVVNQASCDNPCRDAYGLNATSCPAAQG